MHYVFIDHLLLILTFGVLAGFLCRQLSLPPLLGYLVCGTLLGENVLALITDDIEEVSHLAEVGVFFLLFSIGLELSLSELIRLRRFFFVGGAVQMLLVLMPTAAVLYSFGWSMRVAVLVGAATAFSSTVLVFKALGEMGRTGSGTGRRAIAILLFQDAALVPLLLCIPLLVAPSAEQGGAVDNLPAALLKLSLVSFGFVCAVVVLRSVFNRWLIPKITSHRSPDLVVLMALSILGLVTLAAQKAGLPPALGAFAAGLIFGGNRWSEQVDTLILPFREAFSAIFFVSLGLLIDLSLLRTEPVTLLGGLVLLALCKAIAATVALKLTGMRLSDSWKPALGLAHVGEFAFVMLVVAGSAGAISSENQQRLITLFGLTLLQAPILIRFGFRSASSEPGDPARSGAEELPPIPEGERSCLVIGMGPVGRAVASRLDTLGYEVAVIDSNPLNLQAFIQHGFIGIAGDAREKEVLSHAGIDRASVIVICIPIDEVAASVTRQCRDLNETAAIIVRCRYANQRDVIRTAGADTVISEEARSTKELVAVVEDLDRST